MVQKSPYNKFLKIVLFSLFASLLVTSCLEDTSCGQNTETALLFSMYKVSYDSTAQRNKAVRNMSSLYVFMDRDRQDTLYPRQTDTLAMVPFELNDTVTTLFLEKDSILDEIKIVHGYPTGDFVSVNCGFVPSYEIKTGSFSNAILDSILIVNPLVTSDVYQTNILLFY